MREKNVEKKSSKKSAKTRFLYLHVYIVTKKWGKKKRETIFPEKHEYCQLEMLGKISSLKSAKTLLLYSHENRDQKMVKKRAK